jgi:hypothetical protein
VEVLAAYSHSAQAADLRLCRTWHLPARCVQRDQARSVRGASASASMSDEITELITPPRRCPRREPQQRQTPPTHRRCPPHPVHPSIHEGHTHRRVSVARSCLGIHHAHSGMSGRLRRTMRAMGLASRVGEEFLTGDARHTGLAAGPLHRGSGCVQPIRGHTAG